MTLDPLDMARQRTPYTVALSASDPKFRFALTVFMCCLEPTRAERNKQRPHQKNLGCSAWNSKRVPGKKSPLEMAGVLGSMWIRGAGYHQP